MTINDHNYFLHFLSHLFPKICTRNLSLNSNITLSYSYLDPSNIEWIEKRHIIYLYVLDFHSLSILSLTSPSYPKSQKPNFNLGKITRA